MELIKVIPRISSKIGKERRDAEQAERKFQVEKLLTDFSNKSVRDHGLSPLDYVRLLQKQNFRCAICQEEFVRQREGRRTNATVDHDHSPRFGVPKKAKVRGLLCGHCNILLGNARDNPATLVHAIRYLRDCAKELNQKMKFDDALIALLKTLLRKIVGMRHKNVSYYGGPQRYR